MESSPAVVRSNRRVGLGTAAGLLTVCVLWLSACGNCKPCPELVTAVCQCHGTQSDRCAEAKEDSERVCDETPSKASTSCQSAAATFDCGQE